jgi:hypothetical protein
MNELEATIQVKANVVIKELKGLVTEVFWVLLPFLLAAWSHWCFDLKVSLLLHKVVLWFLVLLDIKGVLNDNKGILLHKANMVDINLAVEEISSDVEVVRPKKVMRDDGSQLKQQRKVMDDVPMYGLCCSLHSLASSQEAITSALMEAVLS